MWALRSFVLRSSLVALLCIDEASLVSPIDGADVAAHLAFCGGRTPVQVPDLQVPQLHHIATSATPVPEWQSGQLFKRRTI